MVFVNPQNAKYIKFPSFLNTPLHTRMQFWQKTRKFYKEFFLPPRNGHENAVSAKNWENFIKKIIPPTPCWSFWEPNDEKTDKIHKLFAPPQRQATRRGLFCIGNEKFDVSLRNGHENAVLPKKRENFINKFFLPPPVGVFLAVWSAFCKKLVNFCFPLLVGHENGKSLGFRRK